MYDILHSVYLKHDTSFKSLTKRALAQVILKIIYQHGERGVLAQSIRAKLQELTGVKFETKDVEGALNHLMNTENKLHSKSGRFFIKETYKPAIKKAVDESNELHLSAISFWFGKSKTFGRQKGEGIIRKWFETLLIQFFKEYSYDWISDLKSQRTNGKMRSPNFDNLIDLSFLEQSIDKDDFYWLKNQFIAFLESERKDDNDLLWIYGTCMFSSTLLTVRNFADDLSVDIFKDAIFILDTNILMILELEGFEKNYAIRGIAEAFKNLGIKTKYFYISRNEYQRAIGAKREAILATVDKFDYSIISEVDCPFIKTALKRGCKTVEDFEQFFCTITTIPKTFANTLPLELLDYRELNDAIERGENDEVIKNKIDKIFERRTNHHKREKPKQHDSGIIEGTEFLNRSSKTLILTKDSILRQYAFENTLRDRQPIAIGFDSLVQMLAIDSGGTERGATNFAPLFSKLVRESLMPERDAFQIEDLKFILNTRIQISELPREEIIKIANSVNKLRLKGVADEDVVLEIQRAFQSGIYNASKDLSEIKNEKAKLTLENNRIASINENLESQLLKSQFDSTFLRLKRTVALNWLRLIGMFIIASFLFFYAIKLTSVDNKLIQLFVAIASSIGVTYVMNILAFKGKLWISTLDKQTLEDEVKGLVMEAKRL